MIQPVPPIPDLAAWILAAGAMCGALMAIGAIAIKVIRVLRKAIHLVDDLYGDDERPGLSQRVDDLREALDAHVSIGHARPMAGGHPRRFMREVP